MLANTPPPPYYAVIFSNVTTEHLEGYYIMAEKMEILAAKQPGFLGLESARNEIGITVSYWKDEASILQWKQQTEHLAAQHMGIKHWYASYVTRVCKVERAYSFNL